MALSTHDELLLLRKRARRRLVGAIVMVSLSTAVLWNVVDALPEQAMKPEAVDITGLQAASQPAAVVAPPAAPVVASQPVTDLLATLPPDEPEAASQPAIKPPVVLAKPPVAPPVPAAIDPAPAVAPVAKPEVKPEVKPLPKPELPVEPKPQAKPKTETKVEPKPVAKELAKDSKPKPAAEKKAADPMAILEGRETTHAEPAKPVKDSAADAASGKKFSIQLAALSDPQKVDALRSRLAAAGVSARFSKVQTSKGEVTRVRVGPFKSREEADAAMRRLSKAGVTGIVVGAE
jgi:DedD protein